MRKKMKYWAWILCVSVILSGVYTPVYAMEDGSTLEKLVMEETVPVGEAETEISEGDIKVDVSSGDTEINVSCGDVSIGDVEAIASDCDIEIAVETESVATESPVVDTGSCGKKVTWTLYEDGTLKITGEGAMDDVGYYSPWYEDYRNAIKTVEFGEGITYIGSSAFYSHYSLERIILSSTIKSIGRFAFYGDSKLKQINSYEEGLLQVPDTVEVIGDRSFGSTGFTNIYLGGNLKEVNCAAFYQLKITNFTIDKNIGKLITGDVSSFACDTLYIGKNVTADWWLSKYIDNNGNTQDSGFLEEKVKKSVQVHSENTSMAARNNVLYVQNPTGYTLCLFPKDLTSVTFPSDINVTVIGASAFESSAITGAVSIPNTVTEIQVYAFLTCENLTEVKLSTNLTSLAQHSFSGCTNLTKVFIPKSLEDNIRVKSTNFKCFQNVPLSLVTFEEGITRIPAGLFHSSCITNITIPNTVTVLEDNVFRYCDELTAIEIPEGVTQIGWYCFSDSGLKTAVLPSTIDSMTYCFDNCSLDNITIKSKKHFYYHGDLSSVAKSITGYQNSYAHSLALNAKMPFYDMETGLLCEQKDYVITYLLSGGTNHPDNVVGYNEGETVILKAPTKDDAEFKGWALEDGTRVTEISGKSVTVYAKWMDKSGLWLEEIEEQVYTGKAIKPEIKVYNGETLLEEKVDYTVSYKNNINAAEKDANKAPSIIITGKGNYTSKETVTFSIAPKDIDSKEVVVSDLLLSYNGKEQKPIPQITYNGKKLKNKTDFIVEYPDSMEDAYKKAGTYSVLVKGKGNYSGERVVYFSITENILLSKTTVSKIAKQSYTGSDIMPKFTVKNGKTELIEGTDYTVTYLNNKEIGTATILITGMGGYSGQKILTFSIVGTDIKKAKVTGIPKSVEYTGEEITVDSLSWGEKPVLTVKVGKEQVALKEGINYEISYIKNVDKGTATIVFTGINDYSGTLKKTFKIYAHDIKKNKLNAIAATVDSSVVYAKGGSKPKPEVTFKDIVLKEGIDYTLSYKNHTKLNDGSDARKIPTVIIKGKGNYTGSISLSYKIVKQSLSELNISVPDKVYKKSANAYKSTPKIVDLDGKVLKAGTDYEKAYVYTYKTDVTLEDGTVRAAGEVVGAKDIVPAGTVIVVTVTGKNNYLDDSVLQGEYRVVKADISKAKVSVATQIYTGKEVCPIKQSMTVKMGKDTLQPTDFEIVGYQNNINKGTAKVTIRGVGNYGGTKTVTFTIKSKTFRWPWT